MTAAISQRKLRRGRFLATDTEINVVSLIDIFAILVFYLLVSALVVEVIPRYQNLTLPETLAPQQPEQTVVLAISRDSIYIDDRALMSRRDLIDGEGGAIAALVTALSAAQNSQTASAEGEEDAGINSVNIVADREIPYALLKLILASCAEAGFSQVMLAVEQPGEAG